MDNRLLAINIVGGIVMLSAAVTFVKSSFARPHFEVCNTRYDRILAFRLDRSGRAMDAAEVQAATNGLDRGILENLRVEKIARGPSPYAMSINVANAGATEIIKRDDEVEDGVTFPWSPRAMAKGATSACLTYHVMLPADFDFQAGGRLPGIFGITDGGSYTDETRVDTNIYWDREGKARFRLYAKGADGVADAAYDLYDPRLPRGRWLKIEQEMVLNAPGKADGIVRLWFDDKLQLEIKEADLRERSEVAVSGVSSSIGRTRYRGHEKPDARPAAIQITPYELRVK